MVTNAFNHSLFIFRFLSYFFKFNLRVFLVYVRMGKLFSGAALLRLDEPNNLNFGNYASKSIT